MWDQGGQPWQQWPLNQQQWMQSFQHQQDPSKETNRIRRVGEERYIELSGKYSVGIREMELELVYWIIL